MKTPSLPRRLTSVLLGLASTALVTPAAFAQTTGFNQTGAGPFDYDTAANWVGATAGAITGVWNTSLTLSAAQAVTFDSNLVLTSGLTFGYTGNVGLTLRGDGTNRTITLGGDISVATVSNQTVTLGSATAGQQLNVNLGGDRTFTVSASKTLSLLNMISGGDITVNGGGTVKLAGASGNASSSSITVNRAILSFDSSTTGLTGATRAANVTLSQGTLTVAGGNSGANSNDIITDTLTVSGINGGYGIVSLSTGTKNTLLSIDSLAREKQGIVLFRGAGLGANSIASATGGATNIHITGDTTPTLIGGGGAANSTNISIIPWAIGGTSTSDTGSTFVTYDAVNGIRTLNINTELATGISDGADTTDNVLLTANANFTTTTILNSLIIKPTANTTISGGTLKITSGALFLNPSNTNVTTIITSAIDFGDAQGVIGASNNRATTINGKVSGTGGLVIYSNSGTASGLRVGGTDANASDYTGDTYILANLNTYDGGGGKFFLPNGTRLGDVYLYAQLNISSTGQIINGLNGNGLVTYGHSGNDARFTFGDNNANGSFSGTIATGISFNNFGIIKIGSGTQELTGGSSFYGNSTTILGGTLAISTLTDGGSGSSIGSSSNIAANLIINGGTLKYSGAATSSDRLFTVGALNAALDSSGTGALTLTNTGAIVSAEAANRGGSRTSGSTVVTGVTNFADLAVGARVTGAGIAAGTTIAAIDSVNGTVTLSVAATSSTGGNMSFSTDRTLSLTGSNTGDNMISGVLANSSSAGKLSLAKSGTGTWVLSGANTYTGATTVTGGTLALGANNAFSSASALNLSAGTLDLRTFSTSAASLSFAAGSTLKFDLDAPGNVTALLALAGTFTKNGDGVFTLNFSGSGEVGTYQLLSFSGSTFTNQNEFTLTGLAGGLTGLLTLDSTSLSLTVSAIPEPSTIALLAGAATLLVASRRRNLRAA